MGTALTQLKKWEEKMGSKESQRSPQRSLSVLHEMNRVGDQPMQKTAEAYSRRLD